MILKEVLEAATQLRLDGVELWDGHIESYLDGGGTTYELGRYLLEHRLSVPVISTYAAFSQNEEADLQQVQRAARWAKELGCPRIRTFAGHLPSREAPPFLWDSVVSGLSAASAACVEHGVRLAIEMHNNTLADTEDNIAKLLDRGGPELELIYDGFNFFVDHQDPLPVLDRCFHRISHVHFKNYQWNHQDWAQSVPVPVLQGDSDHRAILRRLAKLGYDGFLSFEYFGDRVLELTQLSCIEVNHELSDGGDDRP